MAHPLLPASYYIDEARYVSGLDAPAVVDGITVEDGASFGVAADHGVTLGSLTIGSGASLTASYRPYASNGLFKWRVTGALSLADTATIASNPAQGLHLISEMAAWAMGGGSIVGHQLLRIEGPSLHLTGPAVVDARQDLELQVGSFSCSSNLGMCACLHPPSCNRAPLTTVVQPRPLNRRHTLDWQHCGPRVHTLTCHAVYNRRSCVRGACGGH